MDIQIKKKLLWATCISVILAAFLISRADWEHFSLIAGSMEIKYFLASYVVFIIGNLVKTFRFIRLDYTDKKLTHWWNMNAFYNWMTATLPGGLGEAATAYTLKRFSKFNILGAFRILLLGRFMDVFAFSALFFGASSLISIITPYREAAIWAAGLLFLTSSIALIPSSEIIMIKILQKLPGDFTFIKKLSDKLNEILEIVKERRGLGFYMITLTQSVIEKMSGVATMHLLLRAFGVDFVPVQSVYCYCVYAIFQIVPVQGIAGIGTQAAWWALALNATGYHAGNEIALGFILHATFYLFISSMGIISVLIWFRGRGKK